MSNLCRNFLPGIVCFFVLLNLLSNCTTPENRTISALKPGKNPTDSINTWLQNEKNTEDSVAYFGKLYGYYDEQMRQGNYDAAARVLASCGQVLDKLYTTDAYFHHLLTGFIQQFGNKISPELLNQLNYYAGVEYLAVPLPDSAIYYLKKVRGAKNSYRDLQTEGYAKNYLSLAYLMIKQLDSSSTSGMAALQIFESLKDTANITKAYHKLYLLNSNMNAYSQAESCLDKRFEWAVIARDTEEIIGSYYERYYLDVRLGDTTKGVANGAEMMRIFYKWKPLARSTNFTVRNVYARTLLAQGKNEEARLQLDSCRHLLDGNENINVRNSYLTALAWYELNTKRVLSDGNGLLQMTDRFKQMKNYHLLTDIYGLLVEDALNRHNFEGAYQYKKEQITCRDSLWNNNLRGKISELSVKYETREKELKIKALQNENALATQRDWWMVGLLLFLMVLGIYLARLRIVAHQTRLKDYAQMLIERNLQLSELTQQIEQGKQPRQTDSVGEPAALYNQTILTDGDWEKFQEYFNEVYPGYIAKLRSKYEELTPGEIRLMLLDKMGLSLKEQGAMLGIGIDAVKKGRYRLKKKYNLENEELASAVK
jgi:DNA-binding CsgD family transcriptional regulator